MLTSQMRQEVAIDTELHEDKMAAKLSPEAKDELLQAFQIKLKENIKNLQQRFENAWGELKESDFARKYYRSRSSLSEELDVYDLHIESLVSRFDRYKDLDAIRNDFIRLRSFWVNDYNNKDKCNPLFYHGYFQVLNLMEAQFIESFTQKFSSPVLFSDSERMNFNTEEKKVDIESLAQEEVDHYKKNLELKMFEGSCDDFQKQLAPELKALNMKIDRFHLMRKRILEAKAISIEDKSDDLSARIIQLLQAEKVLLSDSLRLKKLQDVRPELIQLRDQLFEKNKKAIYQFTEKLEAEQKSPEVIDISAIDAFKPKKQMLKDIDNAINRIRAENLMMPDQRLAQEILKHLLSKHPSEMLKYKKRKGIFSKNKEEVEATIKMIKKGYDVLAKSKILSTDEQLKIQAESEIARLVQLKEIKQKELKELEESLKNKVEQEISRIGIASIREQIISKKRAEILEYAAAVEVETISSETLEQRKVMLDNAWEDVFATSNGMALVEKALVNLQKKVDKLPAATEATNISPNEIAVLNNLQVEVSTKLERYKTRLKQVERVPAISTVVSILPVNIPEEHKEIVPVPISQSLLPFTDNLHSAASPLIIDPLPTNVAQEKKVTHWYSKLIDTPLKKALWSGVLACSVAVLALTGWGLIAELSILAIAGIVTGSFGFGVATYTGKHYYSSRKRNLDDRIHSGGVSQLELTDLSQNSDSAKNAAILGSTARLPFISQSSLQDMRAKTVSEVKSTSFDESQNNNCFQRLFGCKKNMPQIRLAPASSSPFQPR